MKMENVNVWGERTGYIFAYFAFTTIFYFILFFLHKLGSWNYLHIAGITFIITIAGILVKRYLK